MVSLKGKAYYKTDALFKALETAFSGYTKDNAHSKSDFIELKGRFLAITLSKSVGHIDINIQNLQSQQNFDEMPGD